MDILKYDDMKKTWYRIARYQDSNISDPKLELEIHKKLLNIFHTGPFYYYILDLTRVEMEYISPDITDVLGLGQPHDFSVEYIYENLHPDDKARFINHENKVTEFFNQLPPDKVLKYKVSYDYRLKRPDNKYVWILMQTVTIQTDDEGSVIRVLGVHTDITQIKGENKPSGLSFIGLEGEPSYHNVPVDQVILIPAQELFTRREKEILRLIVQGKTSQQIAGMLIISLHTVNAHRKKIMRKSGASSMADLLSKTVANGWV